MKTPLLAIISAFVFNTASLVAASPSFLLSSNEVLRLSKISTNPFGTVSRIPRGGAVHELSTWEDVEALLIRASGEGKLVVMDFSATWVRAIFK